jgi:hypothetical protein
MTPPSIITVDALVDHAVEHAPLTREVEVTGFGERRRSDGKDAGHALRG